MSCEDLFVNFNLDVQSGRANLESSRKEEGRMTTVHETIKLPPSPNNYKNSCFTKSIKDHFVYTVMKMLVHRCNLIRFKKNLSASCRHSIFLMGLMLKSQFHALNYAILVWSALIGHSIFYSQSELSEQTYRNLRLKFS